VRESLSRKVNSTLIGLWFLVAEHLRLGSWDLIKGLTGSQDNDIAPRIAMQLVNEASLCQNRIRKKNYITHQGFELLNGLCFLTTDEQAHSLLNNITIKRTSEFQQALSLVRSTLGHYQGETIAIDPHRLPSTTKRVMPMKKKQPDKPSQKMLQTFWAVNTATGQPLGFEIGSTGVNTAKATLDLLSLVDTTHKNALILADKEHFTERLFSNIQQSNQFEYLVPAIYNERIKKIERTLDYTPLWAGYAVAETWFNFTGHSQKYRLIIQREGEMINDYRYKAFLTISDKPAKELLSNIYAERWTIEEFFNFEGDMGFDRASTFNLNIRYAKMSLALLAQAASHQFRQKLSVKNNNWNAKHMADAIFAAIDGDIKVVDDTIIVTCYRAPEGLNLQKNYQNLPQKLSKVGVNPKIPWLYDLKLDFKFK
jgi:hypothetical protein